MNKEMPPVFSIQNADSPTALVLIADHASGYIPGIYDNLGIADRSLLLRHVAWDIGIRDVTSRLATRLNASAVYSEFSRLLVDANRYPDNAASMPAVSDGIDVPANRNISSQERQRRIDAYFTPYHQRIEALLDAKIVAGLTPVIIAMHSFTPVMQSYERPWHVGVLWDRDDRLAGPMLGYLNQNPALCVGDNEPYSAREPLGYSMNEYGTKRNLPHATIEIRQDLIDTHHGAESWAGIMSDAIAHVMGDNMDRLAG